MSILEIFKSDFYLYVGLAIISISLIFVRKRVTLPMSVLLMSLALILSMLISKSWIFTIIVFSPLLFLLLYVKIKNPELSYRDKVLSVSLLINYFDKVQDDEKVIGKVLPYNEFQLKYNNKNIKLKDEHARGLVMITGSPGSGKTYGMMSMIRQDLNNGKRVIYFDYKGDEKIIKELRQSAKDRNIKMYEMSEYRTNFDYDPLQSLNKTGKVEALLNTRKWSVDGADAHYRTSTQLLIQKMVDKFDKIYSGEKPYTLSFYEFIKTQNYDRASYDAYTTLTKMLELLLTSEIRDVLEAKNGDKFSFDIEEQYLIVFSFVSSNKELANSISSFVYKDLLDTGTKNEFNKEIALYVDEYGTLENSYIIKDILEKGRSCGILTSLSMQDINQIVINTNQAFLNSVLGIINTFIIYSGSTRATAEMLGGVQLYDIESILVTLKKPNQKKGTPPTAMYISRFSSFDDGAIDVFKIEPYIEKSISGQKEKDREIPAAHQSIQNERVAPTEDTQVASQNYHNDGQEEYASVSKDQYDEFL